VTLEVNHEAGEFDRSHGPAEGIIIRVLRRSTKPSADSQKDSVYRILGVIAATDFSFGGRTLLGDGISNRKKVPRWEKASPYSSEEKFEFEAAAPGWDIRLEDFRRGKHLRF
jgi:hypothetical protein